MTSDGAAGNAIPIGPDGKIVFNDAKRKRGGCLKAIAIAAVAAVVLIGLLVFVIFKTTAGAEKQARLFANEVIAGDTAAAFARTSTDFRETTSQAQLGELTGRLHAVLGDAKVKNTSRGISSNSGKKTTAVLDYTATNNGRTVYMRVNTRKDSSWKVVNFQSSEKPIPAEASESNSSETSAAA